MTPWRLVCTLWMAIFWGLAGCQIIAGLDNPVPSGATADSGESDVSVVADAGLDTALDTALDVGKDEEGLPDGNREATGADGGADAIGQVDTGHDGAKSGMDAGADSGVDACATTTIEKVQSAEQTTVPNKATSLSVTLTATAGDLLVAAVGWQDAGTIALKDSAGTAWTNLAVESNTYLAEAGCDDEDWTQIWYATSVTAGQHVVTMTTSGISTFLVLTVAEYASSTGTLLYDTSAGHIAALGTPTGLETSGPLTTTGCLDLAFVFFADEFPGDGTWVPGQGLSSIANSTGYAMMVANDLSVGPGAHEPTATCNSVDSCWAVSAAAFKVQ